MKVLRWIVVLFFLAGFFGCSYVREYLEIVREDATISEEYFDVLNRHTREKTLYSEFETRIRVVATWKSQAFADAYLSEYSRLYPATDAADKERRDAISGVSTDFREFLFYAYVPDRESNDLAKTDSVWKVFSLDERGAQVEPLEIREIEAGPLVTKFFPYVKPYGKFYSVKFPPPRSERGDGATLVFTGVLGRVELKWNGGKRS